MNSATKVYTRDRVRSLINEGFNVREVAAACGVSTQRVYQLISEMGLTAPSKANESEGGDHADSS